MTSENGDGVAIGGAGSACRVHGNRASKARTKKGLTEFDYVNSATAAHVLGISPRHLERLREHGHPFLQGYRVGHVTVLYTIDAIQWACAHRVFMKYMKNLLADGLGVRPKRQQQALVSEMFGKVFRESAGKRIQLLFASQALAGFFAGRKWAYRIEKALNVLMAAAVPPRERTQRRQELVKKLSECRCRDEESRRWRLWARVMIDLFDEIGSRTLWPESDNGS